ncbi:unnamed protein product [Trifolium pratense]|uniref:Uncharacterized protein n=2 Tax=Trifolium pratense TaxID=57577 RepID=A0ACB0L4V7_TRIPR|nr:unnamed protein product [Trifolium pratense]CAJ2663860.1 unnamed protein product [Trifolium pratense]
MNSKMISFIFITVTILGVTAATAKDVYENEKTDWYIMCNYWYLKCQTLHLFCDLFAAYCPHSTPAAPASSVPTNPPAAPASSGNDHVLPPTPA